MDQNKYLIVLNDKDRTSDVLSYSIKGSMVEIEFNSKTKKYRYNIENTLIREKPTAIAMADKAVYCKDMPIYDIKKVLDFSVKVKIILNKGKSQIYDYNSLRIENNCVTTTDS